MLERIKRERHPFAACGAVPRTPLRADGTGIRHAADDDERGNDRSHPTFERRSVSSPLRGSFGL